MKSARFAVWAGPLAGTEWFMPSDAARAFVEAYGFGITTGLPVGETPSPLDVATRGVK